MNKPKMCALCEKWQHEIKLYCCDCCKNSVCQMSYGLPGTEIWVMGLKNDRNIQCWCKDCNVKGNNRNDKIITVE